VRASEGVRDEGGMTGGTHSGKMRFQAISNAGKISSNGSGFDMVRHKHHEETKCIRSRVDGKAMDFAEGKIRLKMRVVGMKGGELDCVAECDGAFMQELLARPGSPRRLPVVMICLFDRHTFDLNTHHPSTPSHILSSIASLNVSHPGSSLIPSPKCLPVK
jgi:hypothetical protein